MSHELRTPTARNRVFTKSARDNDRIFRKNPVSEYPCVIPNLLTLERNSIIENII